MSPAANLPPEVAPVFSVQRLIGLALTIVLLATCLGAAANAVNGAVSPRYFKAVMGWWTLPPEAIWRAAIAQGIFEGLVVGLVFAVIFTTSVGIISRGRCTYTFAVRHIGFVFVGTLLTGLCGGLAAMGLATLSPEWYRRSFIGVPEEFPLLLGYAWVGGSIWGLQLGGLVNLVLGLVLFRVNWRLLKGTQ
jgi:hypothetical protein